MPSILITEDNPALATLKRTWVTAEYSSEDGIGAMGSLHEAGDALVAVARLDDHGMTILGSGVMVGPGLLLTATHVLDDFPPAGAPPLFLTFLPDAARAWLPRDCSTASGSSAFAPDRKRVSDVTLVSCTLNSDAHEQHPLMLAPLQVSLPLIGERLWAFGYRHGAIDCDATLVTPLVTSGLVTSAFPQGRGERMPASCIEVEMDTKGGMSGGPVVNEYGNLIGIVTSSFDGGPSYVTLIWDALRLKVQSTLPWLATRGDINLFSARMLGLVRLKGEAKRSRRGDVVLNLSDAEFKLFAESIDPEVLTQARSVPGRPLGDDELETFQERWSRMMEHEASDAGIKCLERLELPIVREFLAAADVPATCLASIQGFSVQDLEGLEDPEILFAREDDGVITVRYAFELLTIVWTVEVASADYHATAVTFEEHFVNVETEGETARMEAMQRCYFEANLTFDQLSEEITSVSILHAGVMRSTRRRQA